MPAETEFFDSPWRDYYEKKANDRFGGIENYQSRREKENVPYLEVVEEALREHSKPDQEPRLGVLGVGAGTELIVFGRAGYECVGIDNEWVFPLARENLEKSKVSPEKVKLVMGDVLNIPLPDDSLAVVCSHGLLEHFGDPEDIKTSVREALRVADTYICVVPLKNALNPEYRKMLALSPITDYNKTGNYGDEYYRDREEWESILSELAVISDKFGYWVPKYTSTFVHPQDKAEARQLYEDNETIYAIYVLNRLSSSPQNP